MAILAAVYLLPRAATYHGVELTAPLDFNDMDRHLYALDLMSRGQLEPGPPGAAPALPLLQLVQESLSAPRWTSGVYLASLPQAALFGVASIWTTQITNLLFTALLLLGLSRLALRLGGRRLALWAPMLALLCPALWAATWYFSLDYPLTAMVTMGLALLLRTRGFSRLQPTLDFAAWSALGLLIKLTYAVFLLGPCVYTLAHGLRLGRAWRVAAQAAGGALTCVALFAAMEQPEWLQLWTDLSRHTGPGQAAAALEPWSLQWLASQLIFAARNYPWPLLLAALPGLYLLHRRASEVTRRTLLAFLWCGVVALTLMPDKLERYLQPLYPVLCLLTAWWALTLVPGRARRWAAPALALAFAATLALTHVVPTPWGVADDPRSASYAGWYELARPGRQTLARLRQPNAGAEPPTPALLAAMERWARGPLAGRPLAYAWLEASVQDDGLPLVVDRLLLPLLHRCRPGLVLYGGLLGLEQARSVRLAPDSMLVILHRPGLDQAQLPWRVEVITRRTFNVPCPKGDCLLAASVVRVSEL